MPPHVRVLRLGARLVAAGLVSAMGMAAPAAACSFPWPPDPVGHPAGEFIAGRMYPAATFVDLAIAEKARPLVSPERHNLGQTVTFRVIQRWKGNSPDRFTLYATASSGADGQPEMKPAHWVDPAGRITPHPTPWEVPTEPLRMGNTCDPGFIAPVLGQIYIAFREADGRLLGAIPIHAGERPQRAFPFLRASLPREDPWTDVAFLGSFKAAEPRTQAAQPISPAPDRALIVFRKPLDVETAGAALRSAGARPYAVQVSAGEFVDEARVPAEMARETLLEEATRNARENLSATHSAAIAQEWLRKISLQDLEQDGWKSSWVTALLAAEQRHRNAVAAGPPRIAAAEVLGNEASWTKLRKHPAVANILPGFIVRDRPAAPPLPGRERVATPASFDERRQDEQPASLFSRLRAMAEGRLIPAPPPRPPAPPPLDDRPCARVRPDEALGFKGLTLISTADDVRVFGRADEITCDPAGADARGRCLLNPRSVVRLEFPKGVSGVRVGAVPVELRFSRGGFGCEPMPKPR